MHELAIAQSIVEVVEQHAQISQAARVKMVRLQVGEASGVVAEALAYSFEVLASLSSVLGGARLDIEHVSHRARCGPCEREFAVQLGIPRCPHCGEWSADILSGTELQILEMEVASLQEDESAGGDSHPE